MATLCDAEVATAPVRLIDVRPIPAVVQADDVRVLRALSPSAGAAGAAGAADTGANAARDFVQGYLGYDERARDALAATVRSLADAGGGAWFFNGVFGSGKSHLLGLLALLADRSEHAAFAELHPHLAPSLQRFTPRLVVHFSLDAYSAQRFSLEEVFWREVRVEWRRIGLPPDELALDETGSRSESFASLETSLSAHGLAGLVVCIDELSLFLSGREHGALQNDAAFLQFLGQRARRRAFSAAPLWIFAALQKTVEDIGDLDSYVIAQIRDRFITLPLSLAHLPSLIELRLVIRRDEAAVREIAASSYETLLQALPRLDFGRDEWRQLYPFHPATVSLLECAAGRFFSRTRSAVAFCSAALREYIEAEEKAGAAPGRRIMPGALFDFLEPSLGAHPDLRPLLAAWKQWGDSLTVIAADASEAGYLRELMKALLLFKIGGVVPTVAALVNATALDARLPGEGNYQYGALLLEKLRERGGSLALERHAGDFNDRYTIDFGARAGEMARRFTANALQTLPAGDRRIPAYALSCCEDESLPLASLRQGAAISVFWRNTPRLVGIEIAARPPRTEAIVNRLAALAAPGEPDMALFIMMPLLKPHGDDYDEAKFWGEAMRAALRAGDTALSDKTRGDISRADALLWWIPRAPTPAEWQLAREGTAEHLLLADPQLADNRRGRAVLDLLKNGEGARAAGLARLCARLLREGTIATGSGISLDAAELHSEGNWESALEALAEIALPNLFPRAAALAPRLRLLTPSNSEALGLELLRRPQAAPYFAASLERAVRALAAPLGVATEDKGRWKMAAGHNELAGALRDFISGQDEGAGQASGTSPAAGAGPASGATPAAIEACFAKNEWGLPPEQTRLALCALLRAGEITALDSRGNALAATDIGMPLQRSVRLLRPGRALDAASWQAAAKLFELLTGGRAGAPAFAEQERLGAELCRWHTDTLAAAELCKGRLHQLQRQLGGDGALWSEPAQTLGALASLLQALAPAPAFALLSKLAALEPAPTSSLWRDYNELASNLDERLAGLLEAHAFLNHPELAAPVELAAELASQRSELQAALAGGADVLRDEALHQRAAAWRADYATLYRQWHAAQHDSARFLSLRRLAASDDLRAALCLAGLRNRNFPAGGAAEKLIDEELAKCCARDGSLVGEPVCSACRLRLGQRVTLRDPGEIGAALATCAASLRAALGDADVASLLAASETGRELLQWAASAQPLGALLPLLNAPGLAALDEAFVPRRRVARSWHGLRAALSNCRSRHDFEVAFAQWLDAGEGVQGNDLIDIQDEG